MILADIPWQYFLTPFGIPIVAILGVFSWLTVASISEAVAKVMCNREDTELKMEMLAKGYSADEITRVVDCGRESSDKA